MMMTNMMPLVVVSWPSIVGLTLAQGTQTSADFFPLTLLMSTIVADVKIASPTDVSR